MKTTNLPTVLFFLASLLSTTMISASSPTPQTAQRLEAGEEVKVVAFGDSITGIYYHSGSRRAWPEMLQLGLRKLYPANKITVFNAGCSGHTSGRGLQRIQKDVLDRKPNLVVVSFGMNDLAYVKPDAKAGAETDAKMKARYAANLANIVGQCRAIGAEVILCSPNSIYSNATPRRPQHRVAEFTKILLEQGKALNVPVVDLYDRWEQIRRNDITAWRLMMSETIHPSMAGHKCIAQWLASAISGQSISLLDEPPPKLSAARFLARLRAKKPVKAIVPTPLAEAFRNLVLTQYPQAELTVVPWPIKGKNLAQTEAESKKIRKQAPDIVITTLPPSSLAVDDEESYIRRCSWVVNWGLPFGPHSWTEVGIATSSWHSKLSPEQKHAEDLFGKIVAAHDLEYLSGGTAEKLLQDWFAAQFAELTK